MTTKYMYIAELDTTSSTTYRGITYRNVWHN